MALIEMSGGIVNLTLNDRLLKYKYYLSFWIEIICTRTSLTKQFIGRLEDVSLFHFFKGYLYILYILQYQSFTYKMVHTGSKDLTTKYEWLVLMREIFILSSL